MKKKFAFLAMGEAYDPARHQAQFETAGMITLIRTARDFEEAKKIVLELTEQGVGAVELCGAFGRKRAQELEALTKGKIAIGYITNEPAMAEAAAKFFGK